MSETKLMVNTLESLKKVFEVASKDSIESILGLPVRVYEEFTIVPQINNNFSISCNLQNSNERYQSTLTLGVNLSDLPDLIYGETDREMQTDALGEIANVISGAIMDYEIFLQEFGYMEQSPPLFSNGGLTYQKAWGIQGVLLAADVKVLFGYAIWEIHIA